MINSVESDGMSANPLIGLYGASGFTGALVAQELKARGFVVRLGARRQEVSALADRLGFDLSVFSLSDTRELGNFLDGISLVVNCAGPFAETAPVLARAAIECGTHYLDVTGEPPVVSHLCDELAECAAHARRYIVPAVGFFGALPDLMASALVERSSQIETVSVAYFLSKWHMTKGSGLAAATLRGRQYQYVDGKSTSTIGPPRLARHDYPPPVGDIPVIKCYPAPEAILLPRHLPIRNLDVRMSTSTFAGETAALANAQADPSDIDFMVMVRAESRDTSLSAVAVGHDIYGITAPIVGEVVSRFVSEEPKGGGVVTPAQLFSAVDFLESIRDNFFGLEIPHR